MLLLTSTWYSSAATSHIHARALFGSRLTVLTRTQPQKMRYLIWLALLAFRGIRLYLRLIISFRIHQVNGSKVARRPNNRLPYIPLAEQLAAKAISLPTTSAATASTNTFCPFLFSATPLQFLPYRLAGPSYTRPWQTGSKSFAMSETSEIRGAKSQAVVIAHSLGTSCKVGFCSQTCILFISTALN